MQFWIPNVKNPFWPKTHGVKLGSSGQSAQIFGDAFFLIEAGPLKLGTPFFGSQVILAKCANDTSPAVCLSVPDEAHLQKVENWGDSACYGIYCTDRIFWNQLQVTSQSRA